MIDPPDPKKDNAKVELILKGVGRPDHAPPGAAGIKVPIAPPRQHLAVPAPSSKLTLGAGSVPRKQFVPIERAFKQPSDATPKPENSQKEFKSLSERFNHAARNNRPKI